LDRLVEADLPLQMLGELTVTDRLERWQTWLQPGGKKVFNLSQPPGRDHRRHSARDAIVQEVSRQRQSDADGRQGAVGEGVAGDPVPLPVAALEPQLAR